MKTLKNIALSASLFLVFILAGLSAMPAYAQCTDNSPQCGGPSGNTTTPGPCDDTTGANGQVSQSKVNNCVNNNQIVKDLQNIVDFLSAGVGIIVIGVVILGGIQYSMAGDNASAITAARQRIINGLIALVAFIFLFGFVQWLIPGGIFK
jgi:hypothetical protein